MTTELVGEGGSGWVCPGLKRTWPCPGRPCPGPPGAAPRKRCVGAPPDLPGRRPSAHRAVVVSIGSSTIAQQPLRGVAEALLARQAGKGGGVLHTEVVARAEA